MRASETSRLVERVSTAQANASHQQAMLQGLQAARAQAQAELEALNEANQESERQVGAATEWHGLRAEGQRQAERSAESAGHRSMT